MNEIERLKKQGYSNVQIGKKLDVVDTMVAGFIALKTAGEERLLDAAISGRIPLGVAMGIAKADTVETQRELLKAYESTQLNQLSIRTVKRLIDQRRFAGKQRDNNSRTDRKRLTSAESLVNAYRRESQKQKLMIRKAKICDAKLVFIVTAFDKLLSDENLVTLLRDKNRAVKLRQQFGAAFRRQNREQFFVSYDPIIMFSFLFVHWHPPFFKG